MKHLGETPPELFLRSRRWPAHPDQLRAVRTEVGSWLGAFGLPDDTLSDLVYAVSEAVTNAVEHAYRPRRADDAVDVELRVAGDELHIEVSDAGCWLTADPATAEAVASRGRGITMMRKLVDTVRIATGPGGTRVSLIHRLPGPPS